MPHSYIQSLHHFVFATKYRKPTITDEIREPLHAYIFGIVRHQGGILMSAGSMPDHIHLLIAQPRDKSLAVMAYHVKRSSSMWVNRSGITGDRFQWQKGYFAGAVSYRHKDIVDYYIRTQKERHHRRDLEREMRLLLQLDGQQVPAAFDWS